MYYGGLFQLVIKDRSKNVCVDNLVRVKNIHNVFSEIKKIRHISWSNFCLCSQRLNLSRHNQNAKHFPCSAEMSSSPEWCSIPHQRVSRLQFQINFRHKHKSYNLCPFQVSIFICNAHSWYVHASNFLFKRHMSQSPSNSSHIFLQTSKTNVYPSSSNEVSFKEK